jgi:hypothetical protein
MLRARDEEEKIFFHRTKFSLNGVYVIVGMETMKTEYPCIKEKKRNNEKRLKMIFVEERESNISYFCDFISGPEGTLHLPAAPSVQHNRENHLSM